jgi:pSer/pThr/pTyr-binding forkhead associated (FHA) protein
MWSIRVLSGAQAGQIYDLRLGKNIFGRGGTSDLKVQSLGISKEHCEIHMYKDKMMIVDLKSSNGTFVNGVKIQNSIVRVGDKISLFDTIMDVSPTPEIRPKPPVQSSDSGEYEYKEPKPQAKKVKKRKTYPSPAVQGQGGYSQNLPQNYGGQFPAQGNMAMQMNYQNQAGFQQAPFAAVPPQSSKNLNPIIPLTFSESVDQFMENKVMPGIYNLVNIFSFKQVLQGFILLFIISVTLMSALPLTSIIRESAKSEAKKRAASVARAVAKANETALMSGQMGNLSVSEALKEEGIKEAFIIQQSDGQIVAPPEKVGRDEASKLVLDARKETRALVQDIDSNMIGATFPIAVYDPNSGDTLPKFHAVVKYDVTALNLDDGRIISLFMETLAIACVFGLLLYQLFARLIEFPIRSLNNEISKAMLEKSDRTAVEFEYPAYQKLISNINTILNRAWSGEAANSMSQPRQNKDVEFSNLVEIISHPAIVVDSNQAVIALNTNFEQLLQISRDSILSQSYQNFTDSSLVQNIESLLARCQQSPFEKQSDRIPFSQFECDIHCQVFLDETSQPAYYVLTLVQIT